jgi:hypothetical protein
MPMPALVSSMPAMGGGKVGIPPVAPPPPHHAVNVTVDLYSSQTLFATKTLYT